MQVYKENVFPAGGMVGSPPMAVKSFPGKEDRSSLFGLSERKAGKESARAQAMIGAISMAEADSKKMKKTLAELNEENKKLKDDLTNAELDAQEFQAENDRIMQDGREMYLQFEKISHRLSQVETNNRGLQRDLTMERTRYAQMEKDLLSQMNDWKNKCGEYQRKCVEAFDVVRGLQEELHTLKTNGAKISDSVSSSSTTTSDQLSTLTESNKLLRTHVATLQKKLKENEQHLLEKNAAPVVEAVPEQQRAVLEKLERFLKEEDEQQGIMQTIFQNIQQVMEEKQTLSQELATVQQKGLLLQEEKSKLQVSIETKESEINLAKSRIDELEVDVDRLSDANEQNSETIDALRLRLQETERELSITMETLETNQEKWKEDKDTWAASDQQRTAVWEQQQALIDDLQNANSKLKENSETHSEEQSSENSLLVSELNRLKRELSNSRMVLAELEQRLEEEQEEAQMAIHALRECQAQLHTVNQNQNQTD